MEPTTTRVHPLRAVAVELDARDITALAEIYRSWRDVLAAAVDALHARRAIGSCDLATELADVLASNGPVPASDVEDAAMALWLHAIADEVDTPDATSALLREPYRTFTGQRTDGVLRLAG